MDRASKQFAVEARAFCDFVDRAHMFALPERLAHARTRLLALYTAALSLPHAWADEDTTACKAPAKPSAWPGFEQFELYRLALAPNNLADSELAVGSLSDDVLDIHHDVGEGLAMWDAGHREVAVWHWRLLFGPHWGDHAIDALRALHYAIYALTA
jgi:hypothetical protein